MLTMRKKCPACTSKVRASRGGTITSPILLKVCRARASAPMSGFGSVSVG